jgi:hypothetical protein
MTRTLVWPDGTVYTIIRSSHETAGAELEMEWSLPARGWAPLSLRSLLYIAMLVDEYPEHSRPAGRLLNATASHIAALARLLRLRPA